MDLVTTTDYKVSNKTILTEASQRIILSKKQNIHLLPNTLKNE